MATGYNGTPPGQAECASGGCPRGSLTGPLPEDYNAYVCHAIHAEANALLRAGSMARRTNMFITHRPCPQCQNLIMGSGVANVWWMDMTDATGWKWWMPKMGRLPDV